jgi:hypothetical protein
MDKFDKSIEEKIGDGIKKSEEKFSGYPDFGDLFDADEPDLPLEPEALMPEVTEVTAEEYDEYIGAEDLMPSGDGNMKAVVKRRTHNDDGKPVDLKNSNPILDMREYHLEFEDGSTQVYAANLYINYYLKAAALLLNVLERQKVNSQPADYSMLLNYSFWYISKSVLYDLFLYLKYLFVSTCGPMFP